MVNTHRVGSGSGGQEFSKVAVLGLGLIGGSLARDLHERGVEVTGQDVDAATVFAARAAGIDAHHDMAPALAGCDLVVLAVPLKAMRATAQGLAAHIDATADATVIDVGSVKGEVRQAMVAAGLGERYVGAHPMAGTQWSGFEASAADLLHGACWAVTTAAGQASTGQAGVSQASSGHVAGAGQASNCQTRAGQVNAEYVAEAGAPAQGREVAVARWIEHTLDGRVLRLSDEEHDEAVALISHVPHVLGTWLLNAVSSAGVRDAALALAAGSFRDATRVALTTPERTQAMVTQNADWVAAALRKASRDLAALAQDLESNCDVSDFFHAANELRNLRRID